MPTFERRRRSAPATQYQRLEIRTSMRALELDTRWITLMHRPHYEAAHLLFPGVGACVDDVLSELSIDNASRLIQALRQAREGLQ